MNENDFCVAYYQLKALLNGFFSQYGMSNTLFLQQLMLTSYQQDHRAEILAAQSIPHVNAENIVGDNNVTSNTDTNSEAQAG